MNKSDIWKQKARAQGKCVTCGKRNERAPKTLCGSCQATKSANVKVAERERKIEVLTHYGGNKLTCVCCGETELLFLSIDHINNDGNVECYSGRVLYGKLVKWGYPPGYQTLCHNCNLGRHLNGGICPHKNGN